MRIVFGILFLCSAIVLILSQLVEIEYNEYEEEENK